MTNEAAIALGLGSTETIAGGNPAPPAPTIAPIPADLPPAQPLTGSAARSLSVEQVDKARATWLKHFPGRAADFEAAIAGTAIVANPSELVATPDKTAGVPLVTKEQAASMYGELRANGVPADRINEALAKDGMSVQDLPDAKVAELDRQYGVGQTAAEEFHISYNAPDLPIDQLASFDNAARGWLSDLGISASLGASIVERAMRVGKAYAAMSQAQRDAWKASEHREMSRRLGVDGVKGAVELAAQAIRRAGPSEFTEALLNSGALNDAWTVQTLAVHGALIKARKAAA